MSRRPGRRDERDVIDVEAIRDRLPAFVAGSLPAHLHRRVEDAIVASPELLAETMELIAVNQRLLEVRAAVDGDAVHGD